MPASQRYSTYPDLRSPILTR